jgi:hypothetical protein
MDRVVNSDKSNGNLDLGGAKNAESLRCADPAGLPHPRKDPTGGHPHLPVLSWCWLASTDRRCNSARTA